VRSGDDNMQTCGLNDDGITRAIVLRTGISGVRMCDDCSSYTYESEVPKMPV